MTIEIDTYSINDLYLKSLIRDEYLIETKDDNGNTIKVYDTLFGHKINVEDSFYKQQDIQNKTNTHNKRFLLFFIIIFSVIVYLSNLLCVAWFVYLSPK